MHIYKAYFVIIKRKKNLRTSKQIIGCMSVYESIWMCASVDMYIWGRGGDGKERGGSAGRGGGGGGKCEQWRPAPPLDRSQRMGGGGGS